MKETSINDPQILQPQPRRNPNILVAYSNDAFELWYLLHFQVVSSAHHRRDLDKKLGKHLGRTYKSRHGSKVEDLFTLINQSQPVAIKRAHASRHI